MIVPLPLRTLSMVFATKEKRERSSPLLNPLPAYVVERWSLPSALGHCSRPPDQRRSNERHIRPLGDAELTERVMILYRHPSENDGGFSVADLPISILNGRLGLRTLKGIRNYPVKFITLFLNYVSIAVYSFVVLIKVKRP